LKAGGSPTGLSIQPPNQPVDDRAAGGVGGGDPLAVDEVAAHGDLELISEALRGWTVES
jgi:hypothetical protein